MPYKKRRQPLPPRRVKSLAKFVDKRIKKLSDFKMYQYDRSLSVDNTAPLLESLSDMPTGDTYLTRSGNKVNVVKLDVRGWIYNTTNGNHDVIRLIIFKWMGDTSATAPTEADILQDSSTRPYLSQIDFNLNRKMVKVVADRTFMIDNYGGFRSNAFHLNIKFRKPSPIQYVGTSTDGVGKFFIYATSTRNTTGMTALNVKVQSVLIDN